MESIPSINGFNGHENSITRRVYKVVLTGGPCGGKTTGQSRLCTFFENLGWKVYRAPETASILLGGGIKFGDLSPEQTINFQENLLRTMIEIENTYFRLAEASLNNCLIICDRGTMDPSAFVTPDQWEVILRRCGHNSVELRDTRYHQIVHMVSAANGAEAFYTIEDHSCRSENVDFAKKLDKRAAQAWVGHPYFDVIDNSTDFDTKIRRMINVVCQKMGIDTGDRLEIDARKLKFLVRGPLPDDSVFPPFEDFSVEHIYLRTNSRKMQARLRKRGKNNHYSYTHTIRKPEKLGQIVEVKTAISQRDWTNMQAQADEHHFPIYKKRRCFLHNNQYFQLDIYQQPCHSRCMGLILLETYSTLDLEELRKRLPCFLNIVDNVTGRPDYSMFNLSLKDEWKNSKKFCHSIAVEAVQIEDEEVCTNGDVIDHSGVPSKDTTIHLCPQISLPSGAEVADGFPNPELLNQPSVNGSHPPLQRFRESKHVLEAFPDHPYVLRENNKNGIQSEIMNGIHNGIQNGIQNGIGYGIHNEIQNGIHNEIQNGIHNEIQNGIQNGIGNGIHNEIQSGIHNGIGNEIENRIRKIGISMETGISI